MNRDEIYLRFEELMKSKSNSLAWDFFGSDFSCLTDKEQLEIELLLFKEKWHDLHDDIANSFQFSRHPEIVDFIYEQIVSGDIPEFDYKPVSRKCVWALADIGTKQAKEKLLILSKLDNEYIREFASKRLVSWEKETKRKGRIIQSLLPFEKRIRIETYSSYIKRMPLEGKHIIAYQSNDEIVLYQAYKPSIADWIVKNQKLGGADFSFNRMSWVKPNFLWMMYRSGWATKENQERVLAIRVSIKDWEKILKKAVLSSFSNKTFASLDYWKSKISNSEVRLQWDPDHDPLGNKLNRKAIQIGLKGSVLNEFGTKMIISIEDITNFVSAQKLYIDKNELEKLEIPKEEIFEPSEEFPNIELDI